ncbi:hypothetical protein A2Z22_01185 [Candidatus Woesebacteria bacterium RBG_16_34_12]|uniref:Phosphoribosyltransferase domain-containing protein n=1 Tax=Candidatus Woesebacteria bacterium RBG_16_34_12 TaxID=1802480 RepID=A0A1F7X9D9_9BACT|nr:MAG: hypothetical protein A2Z22_01185 [Candidatus Woesebacteria bacterium RBG_16_34_12]
MSRKFTDKDTNPMSYEEFGKVVNKLIKKLEDYSKAKGVNFDIVAPLLRSGGVPGSIISIHFQITRIFPIQFKWFYNPKLELRKLLSIPKILQNIPKNPNILICETNTGTGETAKAAIKLIRKQFPKCKLYYATVAKVFGSPNRFKEIEEYFYGIQTDENLIASKIQIKELNLRKKITIFPWESVKHELDDINAVSLER